MLTKHQLECLKFETASGILAGLIEYSKPLNPVEVTSYARSMVMNHLKKAKELNGNQVYGVGQVVPAAVAAPKQSKASAGIDMNILPDDLRAFVESIMV